MFQAVCRKPQRVKGAGSKRETRGRIFYKRESPVKKKKKKERKKRRRRRRRSVFVDF